MDDFLKTEFIIAGLLAATSDSGQQRQALAYTLALLTSARKDAREAAKRQVREWMKAGQTIKEAAQLAEFANRGEM